MKRYMATSGLLLRAANEEPVRAAVGIMTFEALPGPHVRVGGSAVIVGEGELRL